MKKFIALLLVMGALGGGGYYYWKTKVAAAEVPKAAIPTAKVEKGTIRLEVPTTGKVVSNLDVDIKCKASGVIIKLPFDVSESVKKGDLLLELDPIDEQRSLQQTQASLDASQAKLSQAKQNLEVAQLTLKTDGAKAQTSIVAFTARRDRARIKAARLAEAYKSQAVTQEEVDIAATDAVEAQTDLDTAITHLEEMKTQEVALEVKRLDIKSMEAQVKSNEEDVKIHQQRVDDCKVFAPMDGVVSVRGVQVGLIMSSGISNVGGGTTALTLSDLSRVFVLASVDESDIGKVELKRKVMITADAYPDARFMGEVTRVATKGVNVSNVVTFEVKIEVTSKNKVKLKPEMTTNVTIIAAEKEDALKIPAEAVARKKGKRVVMLQKEGETTEEREVEIGINDGVSVEVVSGLSEGDVVQVKKSDAESRWRGDPSRNPAARTGGFNAFGGGGGGGGGGGRGGGR